MAIIGGYVLILIIAFIVWVALMSKFKKVGKKITKKVEKTFGESKGNKKND